MAAFYNEIDPYAAEWLRNLIKKGLIADGEVSTQSIVDLRPADLAGFTQCHFFAGIGGWSHALRLAGWSDDRPIWTGSCPCQPFSVAGKGAAQADDRHLWPVFFTLIAAFRPPVVMGEQVAAAVGKSWLDGVSADLEGIGYATGAAVVPACAVNAPHRRDRLWFVADAQSGRRSQGIADTGGLREGDGTEGSAGRSAQHGDDWFVADANHDGRQPRRWDDQAAGHGDSVAAAGGSDGSNVGDADGSRGEASLSTQSGRHERLAEIPDDRSNRRSGSWGEYNWIAGADGKARRVEPTIRLLAHGVPGRVGRLRAYGNAIVPQVAAEVIRSFMEAEG